MTPGDEPAGAAPRLDELIGTAEAARQHDLMPWDLRNAAARGELRRYKLPGNRTAYRRTEVEAWATARRRAAAEAT